MNRRGFILGAAASLFAAPAIVHVGNIMPVKVMASFDPVSETVSYHVTGWDAFGMRVYETIAVPRLIHSHSTMAAISYLSEKTTLSRVNNYDYHDLKTGEGGIYLSPQIVNPTKEQGKGLLFKGRAGIDYPLGGSNPWARDGAWSVVDVSLPETKDGDAESMLLPRITTSA